MEVVNFFDKLHLVLEVDNLLVSRDWFNCYFVLIMKF